MSQINSVLCYNFHFMLHRMHADGGSHIEEQLNLMRFFGNIKYRKISKRIFHVYFEIMF